MIDIEGSYTFESPGTTVHIELPFDPEQFRRAVESIKEIDEIRNFTQENNIHLLPSSGNYTVAFEGELDKEESINAIRFKVRTKVDGRTITLSDMTTTTMRNKTGRILITFVQVTDKEPKPPEGPQHI